MQEDRMNICIVMNMEGRKYDDQSKSGRNTRC